MQASDQVHIIDIHENGLILLITKNNFFYVYKYIFFKNYYA